MVTEVDRAAEVLIVAALRAARPDDGIVGEEGADVQAHRASAGSSTPSTAPRTSSTDSPAGASPSPPRMTTGPVAGAVAIPSLGELFSAAARSRRAPERRAAALQRQGRPGHGPGRHRLLLPAGDAGRAGHGHDGAAPPRARRPAVRCGRRRPLLRGRRPARRLLRGRPRPVGPGRRRGHRPRGRRRRLRPPRRPGAGRLGPRLRARPARAVPRAARRPGRRRTDPPTGERVPRNGS